MNRDFWEALAFAVVFFVILGVMIWYDTSKTKATTQAHWCESTEGNWYPCRDNFLWREDV